MCGPWVKVSGSHSKAAPHGVPSPVPDRLGITQNEGVPHPKPASAGGGSPCRGLLQDTDPWDLSTSL